MSTPPQRDPGPPKALRLTPHSEFRVYSEAVQQAEPVTPDERNLSPGHYLVLLRSQQSKTRRRWCQHTFVLGA